MLKLILRVQPMQMTLVSYVKKAMIAFNKFFMNTKDLLKDQVGNLMQTRRKL
jgi:hypothetical protein